MAGIPLALELAAARLALLTPAQIVERLDETFSLLTSSSRTAPTRHQTLRAALDWSYDLLSAPERSAFRRLAVFAGGFDVDAVEAIWALPAGCKRGPSEVSASSAVLDRLGKLLNKSLVVWDPDQSPRYRLLEPVRQYAAEHLTRAAEGHDIRVCHAAYYLGVAERATDKLRGPEQLAWVERLDRERGNLRAALRWTEARADGHLALRLCVALVPYWEVRGHLSEGRQWLNAALQLAADRGVSDQVRAQGLLGVGRLALWQSDFAAAAEHLDACLTMSGQLGDQALRADALTWLGAIQGAQGEFDAAEDVLRQALQLQMSVDNAWGTAWALWNLARAIGNRKTPISTGRVVAEAVPMAEDSLRRFRSLGDLRFVAIACTLLGNGMVLLGDFERAGTLLREGLAGLREVGERAYLLASLFSLAEIATHAGHPQRAARLLGAAEAVSSVLGVPPAPVNDNTRTTVLRSIRPMLRASELVAERAAGRTLSLDEAMAEAWESVMAVSTLAQPGLPEPQVGLTAREQQVARLLAGGRSDRMIAADLSISVRTANAHVRSLLDKLQLRSRWQVADWANANGPTEESPTLPVLRFTEHPATPR